MKLALDRLDLREEHRELLNCSLTKFEHFSDEAQAAIIVVGQALFQEYDRSSYNAIYPPKPDKE